MTPWEYHCVPVRAEHAQAELDALGRRGWELVAVVPSSAYHHLYLKRQVTS